MEDILIVDDNDAVRTQLKRLRAAQASGGLDNMVGESREMQEIFSIIGKIASSDASVLVTGESGTGKELVARALHSMSNRKDGPFIAINCGAIPENLLESELFGHEKGSFTGAHANMKGKIEYAHRGTLFLDEIGELPLPLQVKLLRFLQEKNIQRVGGREDIHVDARIVAATNIDLSKAILEGKFRTDLFYRVGIMTLKLPPLRERGGDIMLLANIFLKNFRDKYGKKVIGFSPSSVELIESYEWPGNVRELENRVQRAVIMCESTMLEPADLELGTTAVKRRIARVAEMSLKKARDVIEKDMISIAIKKHGGNIAKAANALGVTRPTLYDLMKKHEFAMAARTDLHWKRMHHR